MSKFVTMIENKAFFIALLTAIAAAAAVFGYNVPVTTIVGLVTPIMAVLGVQSWQVAAQTKMKLQHAHEMTMHALDHGHTVEEAPAGMGVIVRDASGKALPRAAQGGFSRLGLMIYIAGIASALLTVGLLAHDGSPTAMTVDTVEGAALGPAGCATVGPIATDVIDCVKAEAVTVSDGFSVTQIAAAVWAAFAAGPAGVLAAVESLVGKFGPDVIACAVDNYPAPAPVPGPGSGSGSGAGSGATQASMAYTLKMSVLQQIAPGKKFNHGKTK